MRQQNSTQKTLSKKQITAEKYKCFKRRKQNIEKKAKELATLCDVVVCVMIEGPDGKVQMWPENPDEIKGICRKFKEKSKELEANNIIQQMRGKENFVADTDIQKPSLGCNDILPLNSFSSLPTVPEETTWCQTDDHAQFAKENWCHANGYHNQEWEIGANMHNSFKREDLLQFPEDHSFGINGTDGSALFLSDCNVNLSYQNPLEYTFASTSRTSGFSLYGDITNAAAPTPLNAVTDTNWQLYIPSAQMYQGFSPAFGGLVTPTTFTGDWKQF